MLNKISLWKKNAAKYISIIGHPLLTIPAFSIAGIFLTEPFNRAMMLSFLIVGCTIVPLFLWVYIKLKKGKYTNFDVSDRKQRVSVYIFIIPILVIVVSILFITKQPANIRICVLFAAVLISISYIVNYFIKCSLHVSLNIYLSFLVMPLNAIAGVMLLVFTGFVGWSRIVLGRHTRMEVVFGAGIG